jgi:hypothetical protein
MFSQTLIYRIRILLKEWRFTALSAQHTISATSQYPLQKGKATGCLWLTPAILATQEAEIRRVTVQSQPRQIVLRNPILKKPFTKKGW